MPVDGPLPGTGDQHDINADATRCLMARHPKDWRLQSLEGTDDYSTLLTCVAYSKFAAIQHSIAP